MNTKNFVILGTQNKSLGINIQGPVLVFFKMQTSDPSNEFEPIFTKLAGIDNRVSYGILDVVLNKDVIIWSRSTSTPIQVVPVLILYINGRPFAKFSGTKNIPSLQSFITQALQTIPAGNNQQKPFMQNMGQSNMYGPSSSGAPSDPRYSMANQGQYPGGPPSHPNPGQPKNMPNLGTAPSMKGVLKGNGSTPGYTSGGGYVEDDDDSRLMVPDTVTPWNAPWEADLQQQY